MSNICEKNGNVSWDEFYPTSKIYRFKEAFNSFFDNIKFAKVDENSQEEKMVVFKKHNHDISIDALSTGEKQIVFRGTFLLKNCNNIDGGIVFVDEPELSMHPKWQEKILKYYRDLFVKNTRQTVQLIIATHSEYIVRTGLENTNDILVVTLEERHRHIKANIINAPDVLPIITSAETNYIAFGIASNDYHIQLYGYLQNKIQTTTVKACDDYIAGNSHYIQGIHGRSSSHTTVSKTINYQTLPTYIRNAINHPDPSRTFTKQELEISIKLLIELCR